MQSIKRPNNRRVSISDVAEMAGVSLSTVSNVLSGKRPTAAATRKRVLEVVKQLNYRPNFAAQTLAKGKTMSIGAMLPDINDHYSSIQLKEINEVCLARGYQLLLTLVGTDVKRMGHCIDCFCNGQTEGVLILTSKIPGEMIAELVDSGFPFSTPWRLPGYESFCSVEIDISSVFGCLLEYLYNLGHRQFGFISGFPCDIQQRYERLHYFMKEKGLEFSSSREITGVHTMEQGEAAADDLLRRCPEITSIVCSNDVLAMGVMMAAHEQGIPVPGDLSITGFDDVPISRYCIPRLTTVRMPIKELAKISVNNLIDRIEGKEPMLAIKLKPELLIRGTCGPPKK